MKKIFTILALVMFAGILSAQTTTIDLTTVDDTYTTTFEEELVLDVATTASAIATPLLSYTNPFKNLTFTQAEINFDVYTYGDIKVLGALLSLYDAGLGRMYFSNGSYLGYNATGGWFDANMNNYGIDHDFIGTGAWKSIRLVFTAEGYSMYVDGELAFNEASTDVTINGNLTDYSNVISFFQNAATLAFGTGSWWSDNVNSEDGSYYDAQFSYLKNISFVASTSTVIVAPMFPEVQEIQSVEYYNLNGVKESSDFRELKGGLYIKKETYSNGVTKTSKVIKQRE